MLNMMGKRYWWRPTTMGKEPYFKIYIYRNFSVYAGTTTPMNLYDKNGLNVVLHFGTNNPRPDVRVMVVTTMSKSSMPISSIQFQAAVPKGMKVKLQPPSGTSLPAYNPILPPAAVTQVMLLANPSQEKVKLKYKVAYTVNDEALTDIGEIDGLPDSNEEKVT